METLLLKGGQHAAERLSVRSALNPLLWLCGVVLPILLIAAFCFAKSDVLRPFCGPLIYTALSLVAFTISSGVYLVLFRPEKLQSEEYQLRQQALVIMSATSKVIGPVNMADIVALTKGGPLHRHR